MTASFSAAVSAFERCFGPGSAARLVHRTEVSEQGDLWITVEEPGRKRWFAAVGDDLEEVWPAQDSALPAARRLAVLESEGRARILSWRPGRRIVAQVEDSEGARIIKGYREAKLPLAFFSHWRAERRIPPEAFRTPRLLGEVPGLAALAFEVLEASALDIARADPDQLGRIGASVSLLQRAQADGLPSHTRAAECAVLDRVGERIAPVAGGFPDGWEELRRRLAILAARPVAEAVPLHRDLHDGQILVVDGGFALLDFDLFCRGEGALDAANLLVHLRLRSFERASEDPSEPFSAGLARLEEPRFREALAFYEGSAALRLAMLATIRPAWTPLVPRLLALAKKGVEECEDA